MRSRPKSGSSGKKTILRLPPISTRNPTALRTGINNVFASAVLPRIKQEWVDWLALFDADNEDDLTCVYCGKKAELLDHLNATIDNKEPSGCFAEVGNLVPACRPCNESRGSKAWESWMRAKHALDGQEAIEKRVAVMRRFLKWRKPQRLDPRKSGDPELWREYDHVKQQIHELLKRAKEIADDLREDVTKDFKAGRNLVTFVGR